MEFDKSKTVVNLMASFVGESGVYNRYTYYANRAKSEGFVYISQVFNETAKNEQYHAKRFLMEVTAKMQGEKICLNQADFPAAFSNTLDNLKAAAEGEYEEAYKIYPDFANIAKEEGFTTQAKYFELIAKVEEAHNKHFTKLIEEMENGYFERNTDMKWTCLKCGHTYVGKVAPKVCPICAHAQGYFKPSKPNNN